MITHHGEGTLSNIGEIVKKYNVKKVLVVTGKKSFINSGSKKIIFEKLNDYELFLYDDFKTNVDISDVTKAIEFAKKNEVELIISVGGGSVMDMAKLIKSSFNSPLSLEKIALGISEIDDIKIPHIAIPTTAGSGSEATHFAVVYLNNEKFSVANSSLKPNEAILDCKLILSSTKYQRICSALDAIAQSIESSWAVNSTEKSQDISLKALTILMDNFHLFINSNCIKYANNMIRASNLAGQAIDITKTTSAHAWSYGFTSIYGIPHGHAVWLTLPKIFEIHMKSSTQSISDPRGKKYFSETMEKIKNAMSIPTHCSVSKFFNDFLEPCDLKIDLIKDYNFTNNERISLSKKINIERMNNNPVVLNQDNINEIFQIK